MGLLGGIMRSVVNPMSIAQLAMGPAGWASLAMRSIASSIGQQVLQTIGQQLGLPQSVISLAQNGFAAATGTQGGATNFKDAIADLAQDYGLSALEQGSLNRSADEAYRNLLSSIVESDEFKAARSGAKGGAAGESIFMKIARILGEAADEKLKDMSSLADQIGNTKDGTKTNEITSLTGKMQARGQEFGILSNAMTNVLKSIGEGVSTIARKG